MGVQGIPTRALSHRQAPSCQVQGVRPQQPPPAGRFKGGQVKKLKEKKNSLVIFHCKFCEEIFFFSPFPALPSDSPLPAKPFHERKTPNKSCQDRRW